MTSGGTVVEWVVWKYSKCLACGEDHYPVYAFRLEQRYANLLARGYGYEEGIPDLFWKCPSTDKLFILDEDHYDHEDPMTGEPLDEIRIISEREFEAHPHYRYFAAALPDLLHRAVRTLIDFEFETPAEVIDIFEESYRSTISGQGFLPFIASYDSDSYDSDDDDAEEDWE